VLWRALVSWIRYNAHETRAAGVFQSPYGSTFSRKFHAALPLFMLSVVMLPAASYFPMVMLASGPTPWVNLPDSSEEPPRPVPLTEAQSAYMERLPSQSARDAYRESLRSPGTSAAYEASLASLTETPESWFRFASSGIIMTLLLLESASLPKASTYFCATK